MLPMAPRSWFVKSTSDQVSSSKTGLETSELIVGTGNSLLGLRRYAGADLQTPPPSTIRLPGLHRNSAEVIAI